MDKVTQREQAHLASLIVQRLLCLTGASHASPFHLQRQTQRTLDELVFKRAQRLKKQGVPDDALRLRLATLRRAMVEAACRQVEAEHPELKAMLAFISPSLPT